MPLALHQHLHVFFVFFFFKIFFFFFFFFYLFDRDRDSQREREHKQGEWERKKQAHSRGAWRGARSHNAGITPWAEGRRLTAVPPRRPNVFKALFVYLEWVCKRGEGETENLKQTLQWVWHLNPGGLIPGRWDDDLSWNPELKNELTEPLRHPCFLSNILVRI